MNLPTEFEWVGNEGARLGYHTIVCAYRNEVGIGAAPPSGCGNDPDPASAPTDCAVNVRKELFDGNAESTVVAVDRANSIENRLTKVLQYLASVRGAAPVRTRRPRNTPARTGRGSLDSSGAELAPRWSEIVIAGHSLGSGQAMLIGQLRPVSRVVSFSGFAHAAYNWVTVDATPSNRYFALSHQRDNFFARACYACLALALTPKCPLEHFTILPPAPDPAHPFLPDPANPFLTENRQPPFGSSQLVTDLDPAPNPPQALLDLYHPSTTRDGWIRKEADGTPSQLVLTMWRSSLGDSDADALLDQVDPCPLVADATCPQCPVGGTVPGTLALTLGPSAMFGRGHTRRHAHLRREHDRQRDHHGRRRDAHRKRPRPPN